ncbi:PilN domain-containing protein [Luteimonas yindakuii]|uniref:PilN domain-containing protein n=1 Tax=Luteimonas yindakuii TaxID=2565782 RepID=A0A4Z1R5V4_9GAMM|nr:PilN domain-containing protein [Luteimonas yindakuii]TKS54830.1 PilN domain-containing protein [Luteimonas yindakuii]
MAGAVDASATPAIATSRAALAGRLRPRLVGAWEWWTTALLAWLPLRLRERLGLLPQRLLLRLHGTDLAVALERAGEPRALAVLPWHDSADGVRVLSRVLAPQLAEMPRWLVLPAGSGLRRTLRLPAAAAERLRDVVSFEIDRQTPFPTQSAVFDARVIALRDDGQLDAELVVVPRRTLDDALATLGPVADTLAGVDLDDGSGQSLGIDLLPANRRLHRTDPRRRWNLLLAAIALCALVAGMWQVLDNRRAAADAFEDASRPVIAQARAASVQRQRLANLIDGMRYLDTQRAARPTMVEILDELSRRLPDSTYLEKLAVENDRLLLIGLSSEASALVGQLEGSPLWRSPALTGALQPDPRSRRDRFTLTAELAVTEVANAPAARGGSDAGG